jgi:hypothetical protein
MSSKEVSNSVSRARRSTMCIGFSSLVASNMPQAEAEQILMRDIEAANGGSR